MWNIAWTCVPTVKEHQENIVYQYEKSNYGLCLNLERGWVPLIKNHKDDQNELGKNEKCCKYQEGVLEILYDFDLVLLVQSSLGCCYFALDKQLYHLDVDESIL